MLSFLVTLFLFVRAQCSISSYEPFPPHSPHLANNITPLDSANRKSLQHNRVVDCDMEDIFNIIGLNEMQELIEALAARKGSTPFAILRTLHKKMKNKEAMEETMFNSIDKVPIPDLMRPPLVEMPPPLRLPPAQNGPAYSLPSNGPAYSLTSNGPAYSLPSNGPLKHVHEEDTDVVIIPVAPSQNSLPNKLPPVMTADFRSRNDASDIYNNVGSSIGRINQVLPGMFTFPPMKNNQQRPPFGAIVRVDTNDPLSPIGHDITVTVSPFMTVLEALRQAEIAYQNILGLDHDTDVIAFTHSTMLDCYIVNQISDVLNNEEYAWKVSIADRERQVLYNNFCLPSGRDALVKPGTLISLSYVHL